MFGHCTDCGNMRRAQCHPGRKSPSSLAPQQPSSLGGLLGSGPNLDLASPSVEGGAGVTATLAAGTALGTAG